MNQTKMCWLLKESRAELSHLQKEGIIMMLALTRLRICMKILNLTTSNIINAPSSDK
jgi:hypothetical protein